MLKKLLKYDFLAIFKYWWIPAVSSVGLAVIGGVCMNAMINMPEVDPNLIVMLLSMGGMYLSMLGISAFAVISEILIFLRFYKNFFTDEGYLTFTLPVKRSQLLNSKLISAAVALSATVAVVLFDICLLLAIGTPDFFDPEPWQSMLTSIIDSIDTLGIYFFIYAVEAMLIVALLSFSSLILIYICITLASVLVRRARVITAIGIYYVVYGAITFALEIIYFFGIIFMAGSISGANAIFAEGIVALILLLIVALCAAIAVAAYMLEYYLLDKKLNLT